MEVRSGVEGKDQVDLFDGGRRREGSASVKGSREDKFLETGTEDQNK